MYKNIPIEFLAEVQDFFRQNKGNMRGVYGNRYQGLRYVFRGPRYDALKVSTRKKDAFAFSVYFR